jgi:peptidoglycan hydrolase-like protein with peptidoglycan-binding domain
MRIFGMAAVLAAAIVGGCAQAPVAPAVVATPNPSKTADHEPPAGNHLVIQVQRQLLRLGYLPGRADGIAGPKTASAITKYEQDHALTVDGVSSHTVLRALQADGSPSGGGWVMPPPPSDGSPAPAN